MATRGLGVLKKKCRVYKLGDEQNYKGTPRVNVECALFLDKNDCFVLLFFYPGTAILSSESVIIC